VADRRWCPGTSSLLHCRGAGWTLWAEGPSWTAGYL